MHRILVLVVVGLGLAVSGQAQPTDIGVEASAQPSTVGPDGTVTFRLRVDGASLSDVDVPEAPPTENLVLRRSTPSTRQSLSVEGGALRRTVVIEWTYRPLREGRARIGPADVVVKGKRYTTAELRVKVASSPPRAAGRASRDGRAPSDPGSEAWEAARLSPKSVFLQGRTSEETAYQGQQVTAVYRLFFRPRVRLRSSRLAGAWDAPGFWREELDVSPRPVPQATTVRGRTYETIVLKRVALFPTRTGQLRVDPLRVETEAQGTERGLRGRYEAITVASESLSVAVRPLPSGAPPSFRGAVGQFALSARTEADSVAVGDGAALRVTVRGTGNIPTLSRPAVEGPSALRVYEPEEETEIDRSGSTVRGSRTFTYTLVPQRAGRHTLPPISFSYFDPKTERYETVRAETVTIHATGEAASAVAGRTGDGFPVGDIAGLTTEQERWARTDTAPLHRRSWPYAVLLGLVLLAGGGVVYRRSGGSAAPGAAANADDTPDAIRARLETARQHHRAGDARAFYTALNRAVHALLAERLDCAPDVDRARLDRLLARRHVPEADRAALDDLLEACDQARFGPDDTVRPTRKELLGRAESLLRRLDKALRTS